jgi:formylglycine-generating enzyme required for sulfatase activity
MGRLVSTGSVLTLIAGLAGSATDSSAAIPEPDFIAYGTVTQGGAPVPSGTVGVKRAGSVVSSAGVTAGGAYAVRVPLFFLEGGEANPPAGGARVGDQLELLVNGSPTSPPTFVSVTERGLIVSRSLTVDSIASGDFDGDGVFDAADNCPGVANASQVDADQNGIGDVCGSDPLWNPSSNRVAVSSPGNAADSATGFGAVSYTYQISDTEVTNAQYRDFLAAVAQADPNQLYNQSMGSDPRGGITRSGSSGSYAYRVKPGGYSNKPVNFVSWLDAARFANWVHNGKLAGAQGPSTTERGAYDLSVPSAALAAVRSAAARSALPTEDEWYKAAYYDPSVPRYWTYATRTDSDPVLASADSIGGVANQGANVANHENGADWNAQDGNVTSVAGAGIASWSAAGTSDQNGNVAEWTEGLDASARVVRGGSYQDDRTVLRNTAGSAGPADRATLLRDPNSESASVGFRLVPEPSVLGSSICAMGVLTALVKNRRRRRPYL